MDITSSQLVTPKLSFLQNLYNQLLMCLSLNGGVWQFSRGSVCSLHCEKCGSGLKENRYRYFLGTPTELKKGARFLKKILRSASLRVELLQIKVYERCSLCYIVNAFYL